MRNRIIRVVAVTVVGVGLMMLAGTAAVGQGNPPSVECASEAWNGQYWKVQINDGEPGQIEANVPAGVIGYSAQEGIFVWINLHDQPAFRWLMKGGNDPALVWEGLWLPGDGDSATMPQNLSHVTICFTEGSDPSTTTTDPTVTTSTSAPTTTDPPTTSTTTEPPATTTTMIGTTTTQPTPSSTTSTTEPATTTTSSVTSTTEPERPPSTTSVPPTTTTETPSGGVATGAGGTADVRDDWVPFVGGVTLGVITGFLLGLAFAIGRESE